MDVTSFAASATLQTQAQTQSQASMLVMRKVLDVAGQQGADFAAMIAQAGGVGQNVDVQA